MIPVMCRTKHDPENGSYGDCLRACVASIMELAPETVPHFFEDKASNDDPEIGFQRVDEFLGHHGYARFSVAYDGECTYDEILETMGAQNPNAVYILFGQTCDGGHVIVCRGGECVHNPGWVRSPLIKATAAGYWIVMVIAKC